MGQPAEAEVRLASPSPSSPPEGRPPPNEYGGRVSLQPELPVPGGFDVGDQRKYLAKQRRRRRSKIQRVENRVMDAILANTHFETGVCGASTMGLVERAQCSRSQLFEVLNTLEGRGVIEERASIDPHFAECTHTIVEGWEGFRVCNRMRAAARRAGVPFTCVAHHGWTLIRWRPQRVSALEAAFEDRAPNTPRRPKGAAAKARANRTPTGSLYRTDVEDINRTPNPGSQDPSTVSGTSSSSPAERSGARARSAHEDDATRSAAPRSSAPPSSPPPSPPAAPRPTTPERAVPARVSPTQAFDGFAPRVVANDPAEESREAGRARVGPASKPPADDVNAVLAAHREHAAGESLAAYPATSWERHLVELALAVWTVAELVLAMRGVARRPRNPERPYERRLVWLLGPNAGREDRITHAIDAERDAQRAARLEAEQRVRAAPHVHGPAARRRRDEPMPVLDMASYGRAEALKLAREELAEKRKDLADAFGDPAKTEAAYRAVLVAEEALARLEAPRGRS
jgi:hypothetical protein